MKNTNSQTQTAEPYSTGESYGGSRFRIDYDRYENPHTQKKQPPRPSSILVGLLIFVVFLLLGILINRYYQKGMTENTVEKEDGNTPITAAFQCYFTE